MSHTRYRTEKNCLNCGAIVERKFCPECGQPNIETRDNFVHMVGHFISDYLHYDSKFFRSFASLFTRPGFLTQQYWEGKRVRYIHPLRLFFFITIAFAIITTYFYSRFGEDMKNSMVKPDRQLEKYDSSYLANVSDSARTEIMKLKTREARQINKLKAGIDAVFKNLKYVTFFLLPVYALLFKLLYVRRKSFYVDHLVYMLHVQSFAYCLFSVLLLLPFLFPLTMKWVMQIALVIILIYVAISLRYLYKQAWWKTLLKSVVATFLLFFITVLTIITIAGVDAVFIQ